MHCSTSPGPCDRTQLSTACVRVFSSATMTEVMLSAGSASSTGSWQSEPTDGTRFLLGSTCTCSSWSCETKTFLLEGFVFCEPSIIDVRPAQPDHSATGFARLVRDFPIVPDDKAPPVCVCVPVGLQIAHALPFLAAMSLRTTFGWCEGRFHQSGATKWRRSHEFDLSVDYSIVLDDETPPACDRTSVRERSPVSSSDLSTGRGQL